MIPSEDEFAEELQKELAEARADIECLTSDRNEWEELASEYQVEMERLKAEVGKQTLAWVRSCAVSSELNAELAALKAKIGTLFDAIKHGDQAHQDWLKDKIAAHFANVEEHGEKSKT